MGQFNSSITRVWPMFDLLFARDSTGSGWLWDLINLAPNRTLAAEISVRRSALVPKLARLGRKIPGNLLKELGSAHAGALGSIRHAFESNLPPPIEFLEWLIRNPDGLCWPEETSTRWRKMSVDTQKFRRLLKQGCNTTTELALRRLRENGSAKSSKRWWTFEGMTSVDCRLETDDLLLLIEGKRTEEVSKETQWFTARDQVVRNLEVAAAEAASSKKNFAVMLCAESYVEFSANAIEQSLPHLSTRQRQSLADRFLGCVTWERIRSVLCPDVALPNRIDEAVEFCLWARRQRKPAADLQ